LRKLQWFILGFIMVVCALAQGAVTVTVNGSNHTIPQTNEKGWGNNVTAWIQAISSATLQKNGGNFTLTANADFGANFGLRAPYYLSRALNPSTAGVLRLGNTESIGWRNAANGANILLSVSADNALTFGGATLATSSGIDAAAVTSGTFATARLGTVPGASIASDLAAGQIASGTFATARLGDIPSSLISGGTLSIAVIGDYAGNISTSQVTSGTFATARLGVLPISAGGTGQTSKSTAFDALSPMTSSGDIIYGGASGTGTRLAKGSDGQYLILSSGVPAWSSLGTGAPVVSTKTADFSATTDDLYISNSTLNIAGTLATAATSKIHTFVNINTGTLSLARAGSDLIYNGQSGGTTGISLPNQWDSVTLQSDGSSKWFVTDFNRSPKVTTLTSGSLATFSMTAGVRYIVVEMVGGGGGGGSSGTGSTNNGNNGGNSTFVIGGTTYTAAGGFGGSNAGVGGAGGAGQPGSNCEINIRGSDGAPGGYSTNTLTGGQGASGFFGGAGAGAYAGAGTYSAGNAAATNSGSGGGGAAGDATHFGAGGGASGGYCRKTITNPPASFTYTVGGQGTGGLAGTGGAAGGNGAAGIIIVTEYFQ
jgi:hypothetical protein